MCVSVCVCMFMSVCVCARARESVQFGSAFEISYGSHLLSNRSLLLFNRSLFTGWQSV